MNFRFRVQSTKAVSEDARNASTLGFASDVGTAVGGAVSTTVGLATGGIGAAPGKAVGGAIGKGSNVIAQTLDHIEAKKLEKFFEGFEGQTEEWTLLLVEIFMDIFINYNIQFCYLLNDPIDSWTKAMRKLAEDSVHRIFDQLSREDDGTSLTKAMIIDCFLKGRSERSSVFKLVSKRKWFVGGEIKTKNRGTYHTSDLLKKPVRWDLYDPNKRDTYNFLYRHPFEHEPNENNPSNYESMDQFQALLEMKSDLKPSIEKELSNDKKIRDIMELMQNQGELTREAFKDFCDEQARQNEEARQQGNFREQQARQLFLAEIGLEKMDSFDFSIASLLQRPRNFHSINLEASEFVTGIYHKPSANADSTTSSRVQSPVKEATSSIAMVEQTHSFSIKNLLLKEDRGDPLITKLIDIGNLRMAPALQEQGIELLRNEGYPDEIELGPFGAGLTMVASTTCSVDTLTEYSELANEAFKVNKIYFQDKLKAMQGNLGQDQSLFDENVWEAEDGPQKYKFKCRFVRKGDVNDKMLSLFPEVDSQLEGKHMKKINLYKIVRNSADKFGDELGIEEALEEAARALESVYKAGYKYSVGHIFVDPFTMEKNVLLVGKTGVGKSLLGTVLVNIKRGFKVSDGTKSETKKVQIRRNEDRKIQIIDTRGLCDTDSIIEMSGKKSTEAAKMIAGTYYVLTNFY